MYGDQRVVIKDCSGAPRYLKPIAKTLVNREVAALKYLRNQSHVVSLVKVIDSYRFMMEYIEGIHPDSECRPLNDDVYDDAMDSLVAMHKAGVTHNDLRRKNLIIHPKKGVVFIDFGAEIIRSSCLGKKKANRFLTECWFINKLQVADTYHLINIKKSLSKDPLTNQELMTLRSGRPFRRVTYWWKVLFRGKRRLLKGGGGSIALRRITLAKLLSPMRLESDQSVPQRHE